METRERASHWSSLFSFFFLCYTHPKKKNHHLSSLSSLSLSLTPHINIDQCPGSREREKLAAFTFCWSLKVAVSTKHISRAHKGQSKLLYSSYIRSPSFHYQARACYSVVDLLLFHFPGNG